MKEIDISLDEIYSVGTLTLFSYTGHLMASLYMKKGYRLRYGYNYRINGSSFMVNIPTLPDSLKKLLSDPKSTENMKLGIALLSNLVKENNGKD